MKPPRLPAIGTCYEIDLEDGRSMVGQLAAIRPRDRLLYLAVFDGFQAMGAPVDLRAWTGRAITHAFELERVDLECEVATLFDLGSVPVDRARVPLPHHSGQGDHPDVWEVHSWDGGRRWEVGTLAAEPYPLPGGGSAVRALVPTLQRCATAQEDEDDCRYRLEAFFGESIPPEGSEEPSGAPVFDAAGGSGGWRTLVVQLNLNQPPGESHAAANRLDEMRGLLAAPVAASRFGVVGGTDRVTGAPQGWIYLYTHDSGPLTPLVRAVLDETKMAKRYAVEDFDGIL